MPRPTHVSGQGEHGPPGGERGGWLRPPPPDWRAPKWVTLWVPVIVSFVIQGLAAGWTIRVGDYAPREALGILGLALVGPLALIGARRFPGPVVAVISLAGALDLFVNANGGPPYVALAFAIVSAIVRGARVWAWASVGACWVATVGAAVMLGREDWTPGRIASTTLGILIVFGIGEGIRSRRDRAAEYWRLARQREQSEVQAERVRIARELHDVLAHSLSQINVQAGVGLHLMDRQPDKAAEALASIKETSKSALDEVRSVLGALRSEGNADAPLVPEPGLDRLPALVGAIRGVEVTLDDRIGDAPKAVQLAMFRIVQESLTNVTRHADATHATVRLWTEAGAYRVEVVDDGAGSTAPASETGGRGLLGMRERAELLGGHLSAGPAHSGPAEDGGFRVSATIPMEGTR
ncbi:sensor histidine kinase [Pseudolysinimonas sp.]|uniref:sensor histidine kinase n=1 Tax=Pseudolysinimonas sp. TaxID=2680009 RepID=UPI00286BCA0D|nr:sensor histidine kinase [Pseudolysinimonas sp.]